MPENNIPELQDWAQIEQMAESFNHASETKANVLALKKVVTGIVNLRFAVNALQDTVGDLKQQVAKLNNNLEVFNQESSKWAARTFSTNFFIAIATLATAVAAFIAIFYRK